MGPSPPTDLTLIPKLKMTSSPNFPTPSPPLSIPRPEVMEMPPLPRPPPSRTSKNPSPPESSRDSMTDNHSLRSPERWRPSKACSHKSTIWREDSVSCNLLSQSSRTPSRPSKRSSMSEEWVRNEHLQSDHFTCLSIHWFLFSLRF